MELAELDVRELGADLVRQNGPSSDRPPRVRRALPERRAAARGQDHRTRPDGPSFGDHTEACLAVAPERLGGGALLNLDALVRRGHPGKAVG